MTQSNGPHFQRLRSLLFVPGSRPERFDKALAAGADACILDLEDAVASEEKNAARDAVRAWVSPEHPAMIRINAAETPWYEQDLSLAALPGVSAIVLPKAECADDIAALINAGASSVIALIETAAGLAAAQAIASSYGVARVAFGSIDFQLDLGMAEALEEELIHYRSQLVLAARLANIPGPIDGVTTAIDDTDRVLRDSARARRLGFSGKLCIHPRQVAAVNTTFTPSADTVAWAHRVVDAAQGGGVVTVDGQMVDKPVLLRAQAILRESQP